MNTTLKRLSTEHGTLLNGEIYSTNRNENHFFKKYQGFGISESELEICKKHGIKKIRIRYCGRKKNIIYEVPFKYTEYFEKYSYEKDGVIDRQVILPTKEMKVLGEEILE